MRILTWNVERPSLTSPKNALRIAHLRSLKPDLALLTETSIAVDLGAGFSDAHTKRSPRKPGEGEAVAAVWFREEVFSLAQVLPTTDPREAVCLELVSPAGPFVVYASILPYHGWKGPDGLSRPWEEHKKATASHQADWIALRHRFPGHHLVVGGDFNQARDGVGRYGTRETRRLVSEALEAAGLECVTEQDFTSTLGLSRHSIDHICLSPELASSVVGIGAWEGTVDGVQLSDHNGVFVDLAVESSTPGV